MRWISEVGAGESGRGAGCRYVETGRFCEQMASKPDGIRFGYQCESWRTSVAKGNLETKTVDPMPWVNWRSWRIQSTRWLIRSWYRPGNNSGLWGGCWRSFGWSASAGCIGACRKTWRKTVNQLYREPDNAGTLYFWSGVCGNEGWFDTRDSCGCKRWIGSVERYVDQPDDHQPSWNNAITQEQDWLKSNLAKFTQMLQGQKDFEHGNQTYPFGTAAVSAHYGAFYILGQDDTAQIKPFFRRVCCR